MAEYRRTYFLEDPLHPCGGVTVNVKHDKDCVFCKHCTDVWWDYTNLIYMIFCDEDHDVWSRPCEYFEEDDND